MEISVPIRNFVKFLDRNYCIVAHLVERLDELRESMLFPHLQEQISGSIGLLETKSSQADKIYKRLGAAASFANNEPLIAFLENTFCCLPGLDNGTQYACLLDYVSIADALLAESARLAELSLATPDRLNLLLSPLYDALTLEPLITALVQVGLVAV